MRHAVGPSTVPVVDMQARSWTANTTTSTVRRTPSSWPRWSFPRRHQKAGITLLEPIMKVVVVAPRAHQGAIVGDINRRRGLITLQ